MNKHEAMGGVVIFFFGAVTAFLSLRMPIGNFRNAGSGMFPLCLGTLLIILSIIFLINLHFKERKLYEKESIKIPATARQIIIFFGTIALATLFFNGLGYPLFSFLLLLTLLRILGMKRWTITLPLSFITAVVSYFLFVQWREFRKSEDIG